MVYGELIYSWSMLHLPDVWVLLDRHTSVVVFGKEIFYGQGISITEPGRSHVSVDRIAFQHYGFNSEPISMEPR